MEKSIDTYDIFGWDDDENDSWLICTTTCTQEELEIKIEKYKELYKTDVYAYLA